jgi:UDP-N-acetylglucosamine 4-epimerase
MIEPYTQKNLMNSSFLVTGGAGFIGSNLVGYLLKNGVKRVVALDNLSTGKYANIEPFIDNPAFVFIEGDIRDIAICKAACTGVDYISHQAALGSVPRSLKDPLSSNNVNITGFLNMLLAARDSGAKSMVYAASSSTYGDSEVLPKVENQIGMPLSPYAVTKYTNELYAHVFALNFGMHITGLRYFNVFGPNQDPNGAYAAVIPLFMKAALNKQPPTIHGTGTQSRDFTYIDNAVQANVKALLASSHRGHEVVNIACGEQTNLNELWRFVQNIAKIDIDPQYVPPREGDVEHSLADLKKATKLLGYQPLVDVKEGLTLTFNHYKRYL